MVTENIFRTPTEVERAEMKLVGNKDLAYHFRKKNIAKEQEYTEKHEPYCFRCAKVDFEKAVSDTMREKQLNTNEDLEIDTDKFYKVDLEKYGDIKRFKLIRTQPVKEDKLMDGIRNSVLTGYSISYQCVERGCNICVFVPLDVYEERNKPAKDKTSK